MSEAEQYQGFKWIKVKRHAYDPQLTDRQNYENLNLHHVAETAFLIDKVRELAKKIDDITGSTVAAELA